MNEATISTPVGETTDTTNETLSCGEFILHYQPVYDSDYVLRAICLHQQFAAANTPASWQPVVSRYPELFEASTGPVLVTVAAGEGPDSLAGHLTADDVVRIDAVINDPALSVQWTASADTAGFSLAVDTACNARPAAPDQPPGLLAIAPDINDLDALDEALAGNADLGVGWPVNGAVQPSGRNATGESNIQLIIELMQRIDKAEHVDNIEPLLDQSPTLSYRLLHYLNSPASGMDREIDSLRHAVMLVGYGQLKTWLSMLLTTAVESPRARPLIDASIRRAHLMQEFAACLGISQGNGDMFVCGVFSLLDQILGKPMTELLATLPLSEEAAQCLKNNDGPYAPYLSLVRHLESPEPFDFQQACDEAALTVHEVNQSIIRSMKKAHAAN